MTVRKLFVQGKFLDIMNSQPIPEEFHKLIEYGILASKKDPFDPMERALEKL
jgi:Ca2+-transporting ATPase